MFGVFGIQRQVQRARHVFEWLRVQGGDPGSPNQYHFVREYQGLVTRLLASYPVEKAMSAAVGDQYEEIGDIQLALLRYAGLNQGMSLIDFGCGSGRTATALAAASFQGTYFGIDVDQRLLDYAKSRTPTSFRFALNHTLTIPSPDASADFVCAFSVFTHLKHSETFLYLKDIHRVLRPSGKLVFSFIEFAEPSHWPIFEGTVDSDLNRPWDHLNQFTERNVIDLWCAKLGYEREFYVQATEAPWGGGRPFGQSVVVLRRP